MPLPKQVRPHTVGTKEVVLRGGPPSVDGGQSNRQVNQINIKLHFKRWPTPGNYINAILK